MFNIGPAGPILVYNGTPSEGVMGLMSPAGVLESLEGILEPQGLCDSQPAGFKNTREGLKNTQGGH